jgi:hypothetical protein
MPDTIPGGGPWHIERIDPGTAWVAVTHDHSLTRVITAAELDTLHSTLSRDPAEPLA